MTQIIAKICEENAFHIIFSQVRFQMVSRKKELSNFIPIYLVVPKDVGLVISRKKVP